MKSSTLMVILLVVQAVLIMGVFAAVPIENGAVAGEEEVTSCPKDNPAKFCNNCTKDPATRSVKCQDEVASDEQSCVNNAKWCKTCTKVDGFKVYYKCNDDFKGTCCNLKN